MATLEARLTHSGDTYIASHATIGSTLLGLNDRGIASIELRLEGPGWGQTAGGYAIARTPKGRTGRVGTAFGMDQVLQILRVVGVDSWEQVQGRQVLTLHACDGQAEWGPVVGIASLDGTRVLIFAEHAARFRTEDGAFDE